MPFIEGYSIREQLYQGTRYTLYRAKRVADHRNVILKTCRQDYPPLAVLAALQHEYQLLNALKLPGVVQAYELLKQRYRLTLVLEDLGGELLRQYLRQQPLPLETFFKIALQLVEALSGLHLQHIIHKGINPDNIMVKIEELTIKLVDFNAATQLVEESTEPVLLNQLEAHLAYLSPEQTGRMNRPVDYRADFYSLGVLFFEMLTGQLPYESQDPLEVIHSHLAQTPPLASKVNLRVPPHLATLVEKLLAKTPEARYATASGLKRDLTECQLQWQAKQAIEPFILGQHDIRDQLSVSHKLYGRESQVQQLLQAFERVANGGTAELFLIKGYSGIGKSSVVKEIYKSVVRYKAYFISGKCDQLTTTPYKSVIDAFQELVKQLLSEPEEHLAQTKQKVLKAVGNNGQVILNILPFLEAIIGPQPETPMLPPIESQNRFLLTFQNLVRALAEPEHPLVLFLDDLQWIGSASLELLRILLLDLELKHILIIGAYRDNEVSSDHPLVTVLEQIKKAQTKINEITLGPLSLADIKNFLSESLNSSLIEVDPLAQLLLDKTLGNPFFIIVFLKKLYQDALLYFDYESSCWDWDITQIRQQDFTENVVDLLTITLRQLPISVQEALKLGSCGGYTFNFKMLSLISKMPMPILARSLWSAIEANLITPLDADYHTRLLLEETSLMETIDLTKIRYRFVHDRIQQAAYQLVPEAERPSLHLKIGRLLKEALKQPDGQLLFEVLDHFNHGIPLITDREERVQLSLYNLIAGKKAKQSNAYWVAQNYLRAGLDLLKPFNWDLNENLIFDLHQELATCHYLTAQYEDAQHIFTELLQRSNNTIQKLNIYRAMCEMLATLDQHQKAVELGIRALKLVQLTFPKKPNLLNILLAILNVQWQIGGRKIKDLMLPKMESELYKTVMALINQLLNSVYFVNQKLFVLLICTNLRISLRYGYTDYTSMSLLTYAFTVMHALNWYDMSVSLTELYFRLKQQYGDSKLEGRNLFILGTFINLWQQPLGQIREVLLKAYQLAYEEGDLIYSNYCNSFLFYHSYMAGESLREAEQTLQKHFNFCEKMKINEVVVGYLVHLDYLIGKKPFDIDGVFLDKQIAINKNPTITNFFYGACAKICFLFNHYKQAIESGRAHEKYFEYGLGTSNNLEGQFYYALALAACYSSDKTINLKPIKKIRKAFQRWAKWCPANFLHYLLLLEAEIARIKKDTLRAMDLYEQAIEKAYEQNALSIVGIAYESAAHFYQDFKPMFAKNCIQNAHYAYQQWGAIGKCRLLEKQYPEWLKDVVSSVALVENLGENALSNIDILSIFKFTQTLSKEIELDKFLQKLLTVLLQNAGAQRIVLLAKSGEQWYVEAEGSNAEQKIHLMGTQFLDQRSDLPVQLVHYAKRSQELILLQDAKAAENLHITDSYLAQVKPQSLLILPVFYQGQLKSLLYLENRITSHAFSSEHIQTLKLLAAQVAISLENARLYYQVTHDPLTGLANRNLLYQVSTLAISQAQRSRKKMALLFLDLDGFKHINDTLGHEVGDKLLQHIAEQLKACLRAGDLAVRLGGDEFVIMLSEVKEINEIVVVADRLLSVLKEPVLIQEHHILVNSSIGISLYPDNGEEIQTLLKQADIALYRVKGQGKGHYQFYTEAINQQILKENQQEIELRKAFEAEQFCIYYQPIYSAKTGQVICLEALLRWQHPEQGLIEAKEFIMIAEKSGLIVQLGEWVLHQVCKQWKAWQSENLQPIQIAVNLSGLQFKKQPISEVIKKLLEETQVPPLFLELELTENTFIDQTQETIDDLLALKSIGIHLTIDDFGVYYSSLNYLRKFPADKIKIDQAFVRGIEEYEADRLLIQGIIALAQRFKLKIVAEGVETEPQLTFLKENGVDALQGYYLSRPLDVLACSLLLAQRNQASS